MAIVASILIAFAIDASWDRHLRRDAAVEALLAARADLVLSQRTLENTWLRWDASIARSALTFALFAHRAPEITEAPAKLGVEDWYRGRLAIEVAEGIVASGSGSPRMLMVPDSLIARTLFTPTFDPAVAELEALLGREELGSIRSAELRQRLASLPSLLEDLADEESQARDQVRLVLQPMIESSAPLAHLLVIDGSDWVDGNVPSQLLKHHSRLDVTTDLQNTLASRVQRAFAVWATADGVNQELRELIRMVDEELGDAAS